MTNNLSATKRDLLCVVGAFLVSRLLCSVMVYWGHTKQLYLSQVPNGWTGVSNWWINPWTTFDSQWYLQIAANSYQEQTTAFFPLYPLLLRLAGDDPINQALFGITISNLAFLIALGLVFKLTMLEHNKATANLTIWVLAFLPAAPFFSAVYTESLFLALLAGTFLASRMRRWWLAGILGALAALTRNPGFLISVALFIEVWVENGKKLPPLSKLLAVSLPLVAFLSVELWFWAHFSNPLSGIASQEYFSRQLDWPWIPLLKEVAVLYKEEQSVAYLLTTAVSLAFTIGALLLVLLGYRKIRISYLTLIAGIMLMNLTYGRTIPPFTVSSVRYLTVLFPFSQAVAIGLDKLQNHPRIRNLLAGTLLFVFIVYSFMFGNKGFLG